ncbi:hypothetical protein TNCV_175141 [Trichonephila clavipes]|nr:hypothetical protein TNCV_175141 [Trichonephila clavipes]
MAFTYPETSEVLTTIASHSCGPNNDPGPSRLHMQQRLVKHLDCDPYCLQFLFKVSCCRPLGASLLRQTGHVNGHTMGLCLVHFAYSHTGVEKSKNQIKDNDFKTMCSVSSAYSEPSALQMSNLTCIEGCELY